MAPAPILPIIIQHYSLTRATASLTIAIVSIVLAFAAIPGGIISAKIGAKHAVLAGTLLVASATITPIISNFEIYIFTRILLGLGFALISPATASIVMQWFSAKELPIVNGLNIVAVSIGISLSLFFTVQLEQVAGWRNTLGFTGFLALVFAIVWQTMGKEHQNHHNTSTQPTPAINRQTIIQTLTSKPALLLGLALSGPFALYTSLATLLPSYYNEVFNMSLAAAASIVGLFNLVGIPASLIGGFLPSRVGLRKPFFLIPGTLIGFISLGVFSTPNPFILYPAIILLGICLWIYLPPMITVPMELPGITPALAGIIIATAFGIADFAAFLAPLGIGWVFDHTGSYLPGFLVCTILSWTLLVGAIFLPETGPGRGIKQTGSYRST